MQDMISELTRKMEEMKTSIERANSSGRFNEKQQQEIPYQRKSFATGVKRRAPSVRMP